MVVGDSIKVSASGSGTDANFYEGGVMILEQVSVGMLFSRSFSPAP